MKLIQKDGIDILIKNTKNTPRMAVCLYFSIDLPEKFAGVYTLFSKLLLKGTKTRSAELLADIIESNGIETSVKCKQDYLKVSTLFLTLRSMFLRIFFRIQRLRRLKKRFIN